MYIVAIAWLYVTLLMALTESSVVAGVATFLFYGLLPLALLLWLLGTPERRRRQRAALRPAPPPALDPAPSALDPEQRSHPPPDGVAPIRPEAPGVGEGAQATAADLGDSER